VDRLPPSRSSTFRNAFFSVALLALPFLSMADAVLDWNKHGVSVVLAARQLPPDGARTMAIMHVAMFNAVNAIEHRYRSYGNELHVPSGASSATAAAAAAHSVLLRLFPEQTEAIEKAWAESVEQLSGDRNLAAGIALGEQAADHCIAMRLNDGVGSINLYRPLTTPGVYVPTTLPVSYDWREVKPWILDRPSQFRPEPPPALTSSIWMRDYNEVKNLGARDSKMRTAEQTESAQFWTAVGVVTWNPILRALATAKPRSLLDNARLFALVNMAAADAFIAVFDAKYAFNFWRPITAIRNGDIDGNDATAPDPGWLPFVDTPHHPEYPCAHCISAGAVASVLEAEFGAGRISPIAMTSATAPGVTHRWQCIGDYVIEVNNARIWGGIHYRTSTEVGERMGRAIGTRTVASALQPLP
jgi:PAP2 superfamily